MLATGGSELCLWDLRKQSLVKSFAVGDGVYGLSWCKEGRVLAAGSGNRLVLIDVRYF